MKVLHIFLFIPAFALAQKSMIEGIGIFKINKTEISVIDSLLIKENFKQESCRLNSECVRNTAGGKYILLPLPDQLDRPLVPEHKVFWLSNYEVSGFKISNMKLDFYNNLLYSIEIDGEPGLLDALKFKYQHTESKEYTVVTCSSLLGSFRREGYVFETVFSSLPQIQAYNHSEKYYNKNCEQNFLNFLLINDIITLQKVQSAEEVIRKQIREGVNNSLKEKYNDL